MGQGFPKMMKFTHKYVEGFSLASTAGSLSTFTISANGMYDPNVSGVGHQPMYFDQAVALYNHYTVIASKITATCVPANTSTASFCVGILKNDDTTVTGTNFITLNENTGSSYKYMPAGSQTVAILNSTFSSKKVFGPGTLANSNLRGNASTNPTEQHYFTVYGQPLDLTATGTVYCEIQIDYIAIWTELIDVAGS